MNSIEHPITEDDIASFLANTPDFFERHAELLATVQLSSGHGTRAVSLQERQAGLLREKIKGLEKRVVEMIRHGQENVLIAEKMQIWTQGLLRIGQARDLPTAVVQGVLSGFQVPQAAMRVWGVNGIFSDESFATAVSKDVQTFAKSLATPYCGANLGVEAIKWLPEPELALSVALIPLRADTSSPVTGLLVLGSPDPDRFNSDMGTEFLENLGHLAGAALSRLSAQVSL